MRSRRDCNLIVMKLSLMYYETEIMARVQTEGCEMVAAYFGSPDLIVVVIVIKKCSQRGFLLTTGGSVQTQMQLPASLDKTEYEYLEEERKKERNNKRDGVAFIYGIVESEVTLFFDHHFFIRPNNLNTYVVYIVTPFSTKPFLHILSCVNRVNSRKVLCVYPFLFTFTYVEMECGKVKRFQRHIIYL